MMRAVATASHRLQYDPERGSFRGWLFTVARNRLRNFFAAKQRHPQGTGDTRNQNLLEHQPVSELEEGPLWDREHDMRLFQWAAEQVRDGFQEASWKAFWSTAVEGDRPTDVAKSLGISVGAVYIAKSRILARIKEQIQQLQADGEWP